MNKIIIFNSLFILITLCSCSNSKTSRLERNVDSKEFTIVKYNNNEISVELGVGLWAWPLPMDFDNDGDMDMIVSCPDTPFNGTYFFENTSGPKVKMPIFEEPIKIGEGMKNLQVFSDGSQTRVLGRGVEYLNFKKDIFSNSKNLPFKEEIEKNHSKIRFSQWKYVDYENDGDLDIIVGIDDWTDYGWDNAFNEEGEWINGPLHGYIYLLENENGGYINRGTINVGNEPIDVYGAPSPNFADFDGDGDLDIICGEFLDRFNWFENIGTREKPIYSEGRFLENKNGTITMDLEMIIPSSLDWDKDGDIDLIVGDEDGRVAFVENTGLVENSMPVFNSPKYFYQKADNLKFGALSTPYSVDWDEDGDEDLIVGNSAGYIAFIENLGGDSLPKWDSPKKLTAEGEEIRYLAGENGSIQGPAERKWGYTTLSVNDWDGDGLKDIIVNSIWGKIMWHRNIGSKGSPELQAAIPIKVGWGSDSIPKPEWNWWSPERNELATQWRTTPVTIDWNKDGLMDLVMLDHEGYLSFYERYNDNGELYLKPGQRIFYGKGESEFDNKNKPTAKIDGPLRLNNGKYGASGRRKICFVDWDMDGDLDLIVNGKNASWFENVLEEGDKVNFVYKGDLSEKKIAGHTTSPTVVDWNGDKIPDILLGAEDGHFYLFTNPLSQKNN
ncbi:FG-GAP repeat domain-containing protein [Maribacter flavus]|uniref:VCBS repeat-containing protein n=1 Tax=Maribacter flavus TaxID=1658664 RepID=A0A5B2U068_9FLAO|nr:VCBS repeat-containing protein [Maribacter flavus]KAA2219897.1 VCBS repeat-containing protein [Maribacter flavus]